MVVTSQSLAKLRLLVKVSNRTQEAELKAGEMLEFALLPEDTHAVITNL